LLELPDTSSEKHADTRSKAQKVLQKSEQQGRNEHSIDYDEMNPFRSLLSSLPPASLLTLPFPLLCPQLGLREAQANLQRLPHREVSLLLRLLFPFLHRECLQHLQPLHGQSLSLLSLIASDLPLLTGRC
jgi:hypothetical protein